MLLAPLLVCAAPWPAWLPCLPVALAAPAGGTALLALAPPTGRLRHPRISHHGAERASALLDVSQQDYGRPKMSLSRTDPVPPHEDAGSPEVRRELRRARIGVSAVFAVCGAGFATWAARVPAVQSQLALSTGGLAVGLFALAVGSVVALLATGPLVTLIGSRAGAMAGAAVLCAGLPLIAAEPGMSWFVTALFVLGVGNSVLDVDGARLNLPSSARRTSSP